jgi:hypothetical protein
MTGPIKRFQPTSGHPTHRETAGSGSYEGVTDQADRLANRDHFLHWLQVARVLASRRADARRARRQGLYP